MNKGKKNEVESIGEVLSSLYRQQQSGLLKVECLQNGRLEKGELYVLAGQSVYARVGKLAEQEALNRLLLWRTLLFSFDPDAPRPPANLAARAAALPAPASLSSLPLPPSPAAVAVQKRDVPSKERVVPRKVMSAQQTLSLPLTHRQRLIYFLIDGQRTLADLSRCSGKSLLEVEQILRELQLQGMISIPF